MVVKMSRVHKLLLFIGIVFLLFFTLQSAGENNIKSITHTPQNPYSGEDLNVIVQVNDTTNISRVSLLYCQITPNYFCYKPIEMTAGENNSYFATTTEDLSGVTRVGYNITIIYDNQSKEYQPIGETYFYVNITQDSGDEILPCPTNESLGLQVLIIILIVIIGFLLFKQYRRKDKTQPMDKKVLGALIIVVIIICSILAVIFLSSSEITTAPEFTLTDIDGETFNLSDFRGKIVVLDLMAIDCSSCKIVERNLMDINAEYGDEIEIISIDVWPEIDTAQDLRDHRDDNNINWRIALDTDEIITKYAATEIAKVVIINSDGYVVFEKVGISETNEMKDAIDKAISGDAELITISPVWIGALAFGAGVASFFSPCSFPLLPGYIGYYLGLEKQRGELGKKTLRKALPGGFASAMGILFIYIIVGTILVLLGSNANLDIAILAPIIGIVLIALGALMLTNIQYYFLINPIRDFFGKLSFRKKKGQEQTESSDGLNKKSLRGLFVFGIGYGAAAAGCTLPIFGVIVISAILRNNILEGIGLLLLYGLGAAIFMIITTVLVSASEDTILNKLKVSADKIKKISGLLMIVGGVGVIIFYYISIAG
jgi:cytochrome c-type biogenesis protein